MGSKAREGAKAMSLAFVLLDFQPYVMLLRRVLHDRVREGTVFNVKMRIA